MTLTPEGYRPRLVERQLEMMMGVFGAVCIEGPMACGKTWTGRSHAASEYGLGDPTSNYLNLESVKIDVLRAFEGEQPHLIDEWQEHEPIWDATKHLVDKTGKPGQYILTGSSTPRIKGLRHQGTGRIGDVRMRPMSLFESGDSDGTVSMNALFNNGITIVPGRTHGLEELIRLTIRGGWPLSLDSNTEQSESYMKSYVNHLIRTVCNMDEKTRNEGKMRQFLKSLSRNECTLASNRALISDMREDDVPDDEVQENQKLSSQMVPDYIDALERVFIVDDVPSFEFNIRSPIRVGKMVKRHLVDPSLCVSSMETTTEELLEERKTYGFLFESMCIRDLKVYAEAHSGSVMHYHDDRGREIDAIVKARDGRYAAFEIKVGEGQADTAAENLLKIDDYFDRSGLPRPEFMCVLCGTAPAAYRRKDGVYVIPITQLRD